MRNSNTTIEKYQKVYTTTHFERAGLFELIREEYHPQQVLYPGCATHITPACFFPHIVFVDQDPTVSEFFSNQDAILDWIKRHKKYRRSPYIQFIYQDFTEPLPVQQEQFDLLLALYTGGVSRACKMYLKRGGFLITNNHQNDAVEAARDKQLSLEAVARMRGGKYRLVDTEPGGFLRSRNQTVQSKRYLRRVSGGFEYVEEESYYIFKKGWSRK